MAGSHKKTTGSRKRAAVSGKTSKPSMPLSIAAGDPLQPAGLSEYLSVSGRRSAGAQKATATGAASPARADALKSAHARWMKLNQKKAAK